MSTGVARWNALVLAGSRGGDDPVATPLGYPAKFAVPVAGKPMLRRVLEALRAEPAIGRIIVACSQEHLALAREIRGELNGVQVRGSAETPATTALAIIGDADEPWLVTTGDHALLSSQTLQAFLFGASSGPPGVYCGLAERRVIEAAYPEVSRTYLRFSDGQFSGCNLFALTGPDAVRAVRYWLRLEAVRKQPWRMAQAFGVPLLLLYLARMLTLADVMQRVGRKMDCHAGAVRLAIADAAIDVDKPQDLELAERILQDRTAAAVP